MRRVSAIWARVELGAAAILALAVTLLILLNVVTRSLGMALFWVDELAVYAMAWMAFLGASAAIHYRDSVAITALTDALPSRLRRWAARAVDIAILVFALAMVWLCWRFYAPLELIRAGFDLQAFQGATFNFTYAEPTTTLGIPKAWVWSVMWLFALGATLHAVANLLSPLPQAEPRTGTPT